MKLRKGISLFFVYLAVSFCLGMILGFSLDRIIYPDRKMKEIVEQTPQTAEQETVEFVVRDEPIVEVSAQEDKINADTIYIVLEKDMDTSQIIETSTRIPQKYIGMNREQLIENLKDYEANPPLSELERGFVSLELLSFSTNQVEVQMNYQYVQPSGSFYIVAYDNYVVVMLEDKRTVFLDTVIKVSDLPTDIQQDILHGLFIPNEESLYDFLENYTS